VIKGKQTLFAILLLSCSLIHVSADALRS